MVLTGGDPFRARVYNKVTRAIAGHPQDVTTRRGGIPMYLACTSGGPFVFLGGEPGATVLRAEALGHC
jgi:hypothetical protein